MKKQIRKNWIVILLCLFVIPIGCSSSDSSNKDISLSKATSIAKERCRIVDCQLCDVLRSGEYPNGNYAIVLSCGGSASFLTFEIDKKGQVLDVDAE